jgi:hypothetical protein
MLKYKLSLLVSLVVITLGCSRSDFPDFHNNSPQNDGGIDVVDSGDDGGSDIIIPTGDICGQEPKDMIFVLLTSVEPAVDDYSDDYYLSGELVYHGDIETPISTIPMLNREIQLKHEDDTISTIQYYLPYERDLPLHIGQFYNILYKERRGFEGNAIGVKVERLTSGLLPLIFIGETGSYGRAFDEDDPLISPLEVTETALLNCPTTVDSACGGLITTNALYFDPAPTSTYPQSIQVRQGEGNVLTILGEEFLVTNLKSYEITPNCLDLPSTYVSYMVLRPPETDFECDFDKISTHMETPFEIGTICDEIEFCAPAELAETIRLISPALDCSETDFGCSTGQLSCRWSTPSNIVGAETYYEVCATTQLIPENSKITCMVYFD